MKRGGKQTAQTFPGHAVQPACSCITRNVKHFYAQTSLEPVGKKPARVAQSVNCLILDFGSSYDPGVMRVSPESGSMLSAVSA